MSKSIRNGHAELQRVAAKLHQWMNQTVLPTAEELLGAPLRRIVTASAYMWWRRIGTAGDRPSQHSFANTLDMSAFVTADGRSNRCLPRLGPNRP